MGNQIQYNTKLMTKPTDAIAICVDVVKLAELLAENGIEVPHPRYLGLPGQAPDNAAACLDQVEQMILDTRDIKDQLFTGDVSEGMGDEWREKALAALYAKRRIYNASMQWAMHARASMRAEARAAGLELWDSPASIDEVRSLESQVSKLKNRVGALEDWVRSGEVKRKKSMHGYSQRINALADKVGLRFDGFETQGEQ